ncbi:MAG: hypothetical protein MJ118_06045 [Clostridia bacterium]|nr:hypothetical protein [Clostridia bacterium]
MSGGEGKPSPYKGIEKDHVSCGERATARRERVEPPVWKSQIGKRSGKIPKKTHRKGFLWYVSFPYFLPYSKKYGRRRHDQRKVSAMSRFRACGAGKRIAAPSCGMVRNDSCMMQQTRSFVFAILQNVRRADRILSQTRPKEGEFP